MKAVILAAGKSTRTYPLTLNRPKPLLKVGTTTLIEYNLDQLQGLVEEVILVVGYKALMIKDFLGSKYKKLRITYVKQKEQLGTGHALLQVKDKVKGKFILMMGDDLYSHDDIKACLKHEYCILAKKVDNPENFGVLKLTGKKVSAIIEKPQTKFSNLANCALYVLDHKIFSILNKLKKSERHEYEITDGIRELAKKETIRYVLAKKWVPIGFPWDLFKFKELLGIHGNVIGENCILKGEVRDSIIFDNTVIEEGSVVSDSIIGEEVYFKGQIHSDDNAVSVVKEIPRKAGKLGAIIGDGCRLEDVTIKSGVKVWPGKEIKDKKIKEDVR